MIQEYDIIMSLNDLNDKVRKGCKGTVLIVHPNFPLAYEVEFVDNKLEMLAVMTVKADDIIKVEQ